LISKQVPFPRTHDLAALGLQCKQARVILPIDDDALELLTAYAVETRYPGTQPTIEESKKAIKLSQIMRRFIKKTLP
jgi:HEPN domain-containing protein